MPLRTRPPTGIPAYPLVLVEGEEKAGKSFVSLALSASERVGRTFVFDLGDGVADEYAALGPYEVVDLDGTFSDLHDQIKEATLVPMEDDRPNVIVVDSGTQLWDSLKAWTDGRARRSKAGRAKLREDPDAEIDASMNLWNDAKDRWASIVNMLRAWPGVAILTAQGREVSKVRNGVPVAGEVEWTVVAEKTIGAVASAWVRLHRDPRDYRLVGARSLELQIPDGGLELPTTGTLDYLIFEVLGSGGFGASTAVAQEVGVSPREAKTRLLHEVSATFPNLTADEAKAEASRLWQDSGLDGRGEIRAEDLAALIFSIDAQEAAEAPETDPGPDDPPEAQNVDEADKEPVLEGEESHGPEGGGDWTKEGVFRLRKAEIVEEAGKLGLDPPAGDLKALRYWFWTQVQPF